jgi:hypothetical protein
MAAFLTLQIGIAPVALAGLQSEPKSTPRVFYQEGLDPWNAEAVGEAFFESAEPLGFLKMLDYGMSYMLQDRYSEAAVVYNLAAKQAVDGKERVTATMWLGQAFFDAACSTKVREESVKFFRMAGDAFNEVSRLVPESPEVIEMRYAAWSGAGDKLEMAVVEQDMRRAGLSNEGTEVVLTGAEIAIVVLAAGFVSTILLYNGTVLLSDLSLTEKLDRMERVLKMQVVVLAFGVRPAKVIGR